MAEPHTINNEELSILCDRLCADLRRIALPRLIDRLPCGAFDFSDNNVAGLHIHGSAINTLTVLRI
jgi:hypothetical protein